MMETLRSILVETAATLSAAGFDESRRRARRLIAAVLGLGSFELLADPERELADRRVRRIRWMTGRCLIGEPLSRMLGRREFWGLEFGLSADCLDPRPESETIVEAVLRRIPRRDARLRLLDLGTGSGCLLLALLCELRGATGVGVDVAVGAVATARMNAAALRLTSRAGFFVGDWGQALAGRFDVVIANPPYIARAALAELPRAVSGYDPRSALDGGEDGLEGYRDIGAGLPSLLTSDGIFIMEVGIGQADAVVTVFEDRGLAIDSVEDDLSGIPRCVVGRRPSAGLPGLSGQAKSCWNAPSARLGCRY